MDKQIDVLKHECGIVLIRLKHSIDYYVDKYGSNRYGLNKLYLLMEKQHNRGQEGAGVACVKLSAEAGEEFMFRERQEGKNAITGLFAEAHEQIMKEKDSSALPFIGECYMGHLRYSTTGRSGISYVHPVLRRQNYRHNTIALCGNFNLTNVGEIFNELIATGQHPRRTSDTTVLLEQIGYELDNTPVDGNRMNSILQRLVPTWDGGFVMCGMAGNGEMYAVRDPWGIRPAFYYEDDEIIVIASERAVIQTVMNVAFDDVRELMPGQAALISTEGELSVNQILPAAEVPTPCSFERIYFSRGSDRDIYKERKQLGASLVPDIMEAIDYDLSNTVISFIPNTAETAYYGMSEELNRVLDKEKQAAILALGSHIDPTKLAEILAKKVRVEKVAIKDIKLRTFISENNERNELVNHVYDITYGSIIPQKDNLVIIDDSIVRGTTLKHSIITILSRLEPKKLVIVSSAPQIRYPDYYGIDMSNIGDLIAFRAAVELRSASELQVIYESCLKQREVSPEQIRNCVQDLYSGLTTKQISSKVVELVRAESVVCPVEIIFQEIEQLHVCCPNNKGDWYFSGDYPTIGGRRLVNESFIKFYESTIL